MGLLEGKLNHKSVAKEIKVIKPLFSFLLLWAHIFKLCHLALPSYFVAHEFQAVTVCAVPKGNYGIYFFMHQALKCDTTMYFWQCVWCIVSTSSKFHYMPLEEGTDHFFCTIASMFSVLSKLNKLKIK